MSRRTPGRTERQSLPQQIAAALLLDDLSPKTKRVGLTLVGTAALVLAVVLVAFPSVPLWVVGPFLPLLLFANPVGVLVFAGVAALLGAWFVYRDRGPSPREETGPSIDLPLLPTDEANASYDLDRAGQRLNTLVDRVTGDAENPSKGVNRAVDKRQVRKQLRDAAVEVLRDQYGWSRSAVQDRIDEGSWTRSRRAAGFLGGPSAPTPRLGTRIRDWAAGKTFERRVHAAVDEIVRHSELADDRPLLDAEVDLVDDAVSGFEGMDLRETPDDGDGVDVGLDAPGGYDLGIDDGEAASGGPHDAEATLDGVDAGATPDGADEALETETATTGTSATGTETTTGAESGESDDESDGDSLPDGWVSPDSDASSPEADDPAATERGDST